MTVLILKEMTTVWALVRTSEKKRKKKKKKKKLISRPHKNLME
jgi:hypothetical protein